MLKRLIGPYSLLKPFLLTLLFSFLMYNYHVLHDLKDSLVVTSAGSGAEVLPVLKFFLVLPFSFAFVLFYTKFSKRISFQKFFYITIGSFIVFFLLFSLVFFPYILSHSESNQILLEKWSTIFPRLRWLIIALINWPISLFYLFSEMQGVIFLGFFFWALANEISSFQEAKIFYPYIIFFAHLSTIVAGQSVRFFARSVFPAEAGIYPVVLSLLLIVVSCNLIALGLFYYIQKRYAVSSTIQVEEAPHMSLRESFQYMFRFKELRYLIILVLVYSLTSNLVEVHWKALVKVLYPTTREYSSYMGTYSYWLGIASVLIAFGVALTNRFFSWRMNAIITPVVCGGLGLLYFISFFLAERFAPFYAKIVVQPLQFTISLGFLTSILTRCAKYTYFDISKEMVFIYIPSEVKKEGKVAVDVAGSRLGKSGSSGLQTLLLFLTGGSQLSIAPITFVIFIFCIGLWGVSVWKLDKTIGKAEEKKNELGGALALNGAS